MGLDLGEEMWSWAKDLFPICRSITGDGVRETLSYIQAVLPDLVVESVPSGTQAFDWRVPDEWNIREAYIEDEHGNRVVDFTASNLHVFGYSEPVDVWLDLEKLDEHLYSLPDLPDAIPYVTAYYNRHWGFCLTENQRRVLKPGKYHAYIDSDLAPGMLNYGELILRGRKEREILLSTYICHPSLANNELSGPVVTMALARWLMAQTDRRFTYRILFIPETIGSIVYLSRHAEAMKERVEAGFVITCVGDERAYSFMPSRYGDTLADRVAKHVLKHHAPEYVSYTFLERGSDERQYCSPGIDLPVASVMRTKYACYPEYHTSLDDLSLITPAGLQGGYEALQKCLLTLEHNYYWCNVVPCEPQMGKRGLYSTIGTNTPPSQSILNMKNILAYADGSNDLIKLADLIRLPTWEMLTMIERLSEEGLLKKAQE